MDKAAAARLREVEDLAGRILGRLNQELLKLGFAAPEVKLRNITDASFRLERDPSSGDDSLVGDWRDERGEKLGMLLFHADGSFYVEHDVVRPHPSRSQWFVEAVNAWGRDAQIKAEARLLPMPD